MAAEEITIGLVDPEAVEPFVLEALADHFTGPDSQKKRTNYVRWLKENPVAGSFYLAARVKGEFASFVGFMAREAIGFDRSFKVALAFAAATRPAFSGRSLYRRLAQEGWDEAGRRGFDVALGYTSRKYVLDMELRMGWEAVSAGAVLVLPLDPPAIIAARWPLARPVAPLVKPAATLLQFLASRRAQNRGGMRVQRTSGFSRDYDALNEELRIAPANIFSKDRRTLDWLYLSRHNPFDYDIVEARDADRLVGFGVGRRMDLAGVDGYALLDLVARPGCQAAMEAVAAEFMRVALPQRPQAIAALTTPGLSADRALRRLGFLDSRQRFTLIRRQTGENASDEAGKPADWVHLWGNNDTV